MMLWGLRRHDEKMSIYKGWHRFKNGTSHLLEGGISTAMPTYGESYGGGSSPTTYSVWSLCGLRHLGGRDPWWSLSEDVLDTPCKTCLRLA